MKSASGQQNMNITLKEHQKIWTFATVSKVSDIENEWGSMGKKLFKAFLLIQERFVGNIYIEKIKLNMDIQTTLRHLKIV